MNLANNRLIALLDLPAKAYARLLLEDLEAWAQENTSKHYIMLYDRPAEQGFGNLDLMCLRDLVKYYIRTLQALDTTLKAETKTIFEEKGSP
ncbi:hypothetical protein NDU88_002076 [Pleurodeles waltl]|uniref:Uncharacterized protein n=1 Tax=Pleurodeles waltl TaxID=8319 RepID=A0AAV7VYB1_PLEWA|nr:hypothetical protein NDU88_002076 [Pleurodeles waltl]